MNDSESSGERNRRSLNSICVIGCRSCELRVEGLIGISCKLYKELQNLLIDEYSWKAEPKEVRAL